MSKYEICDVERLLEKRSFFFKFLFFKQKKNNEKTFKTIDVVLLFCVPLKAQIDCFK